MCNVTLMTLKVKWRQLTNCLHFKCCSSLSLSPLTTSKKQENKTVFIKKQYFFFLVQLLEARVQIDLMWCVWCEKLYRFPPPSFLLQSLLLCLSLCLSVPSSLSPAISPVEPPLASVTAVLADTPKALCLTNSVLHTQSCQCDVLFCSSLFVSFCLLTFSPIYQPDCKSLVCFVRSCVSAHISLSACKSVSQVALSVNENLSSGQSVCYVPSLYICLHVKVKSASGMNARQRYICVTVKSRHATGGTELIELQSWCPLSNRLEDSHVI